MSLGAMLKLRLHPIPRRIGEAGDMREPVCGKPGEAQESTCFFSRGSDVYPP